MGGGSRPQSQSQLPPVVNYHLGYGRGQEFSGGTGGVGVGANGSGGGGPQGSDILSRLFQSASAQGAVAGNGNGNGNGVEGVSTGY